MLDDITKKDHLLDALYELALDPGGFSRFTEIWEQYLTDHGVGEKTTANIADTVEPHFERAFKLLQQLGRLSSDGITEFEQYIQNKLVPCVVLDRNGNIESSNRLAQSLVSERPTSLFDLVHADSQRALKTALQCLLTSDQPIPLLVLLSNKSPSVILLQTLGDSETVIANFTSTGWQADVNTNLKQLFDLTDRECEIAKFLYQGLPIKEIAQQQSRSIETIRKQVTSLLNKTGTHQQANLMKLLTSFNIVPEVLDTHAWHHSSVDDRKFDLKDGRTLAYYDTLKGDAGTMVVLHGVLHDTELPPPLHAMLCERGYRIVGVSRAWFGDSSPTKRGTNLLECASNDLLELLTGLEVTQATLIGIMAGSLHAFQFAAMQPNLVTQIINLSGMVPIVSDEQLKGLPKGVRGVARSARYFPKVLPALIRTAIALIDRGDITRLFEIGYRNSPLDLAATKRPDIHQRLSKGYQFAVRHGYAAYTYEGIEIMKNMADVMDLVSCPVHYIHGNQDGLTSIDSVDVFCDNYANVSTSKMENAGNLMIYTEPEATSAAVAKVLDGIS